MIFLGICCEQREGMQLSRFFLFISLSIQQKQLMLQTVPSHKMMATFEFQAFSEQARFNLASNSKQSFLSLKSSANGNDEDPLTITPFDKDSKIVTNLSSKSLAQEEGEEWPEIVSIVRKIKSLQSKLRNERKVTMELNEKIKEYENNTFAVEEQRRKAAEEALAYQENYNQLEVRVKQLEDILAEKEGVLTEKQQLIENIQFGQLKKNSEYDEKIRKMNTQIKDLMDKLRKAKIEVQKERKGYQELKDSMQSQLEQLQSQKESYLFEQMERLKCIIESSKEEREVNLYQEIDQLNRKIYVQEQEIKRKTIELSLADRKKQQAINDITQKKDQEIKVQKSLFKALTEKMNKLQEEIKTTKNQNAPENNRNPRRILRTSNNRSNIEEEISFELSPDKV